jgi:hypothetical protein
LLLGSRQIRRIVDAQPLGIFSDKAVPLGEELPCVGEVVHADAEVDSGNAGTLEAPKSASVKVPG